MSNSMVRFFSLSACAVVLASLTGLSSSRADGSFEQQINQASQAEGAARAAAKAQSDRNYIYSVAESLARKYFRAHLTGEIQTTCGWEPRDGDNFYTANGFSSQLTNGDVCKFNFRESSIQCLHPNQTVTQVSFRAVLPSRVHRSSIGQCVDPTPRGSPEPPWGYYQTPLGNIF